MSDRLKDFWCNCQCHQPNMALVCFTCWLPNSNLHVPKPNYSFTNSFNPQYQLDPEIDEAIQRINYGKILSRP